MGAYSYLASLECCEFGKQNINFMKIEVCCRKLGLLS